MLEAEPVRQGVDGTRQIGLRRVTGEPGDDLDRTDWLDQRGGQRHGLDTKAGVDGVELFREQPNHVPGVA